VCRALYITAHISKCIEAILAEKQTLAIALIVPMMGKIHIAGKVGKLLSFRLILSTGFDPCLNNKALNFLRVRVSPLDNKNLLIIDS
jgi:hypothetical protein